MGYNKLIHLSRYCCVPEDNIEFELIKEQAQLSGIGESNRINESSVVYYSEFHEGINTCGSNSPLHNEKIEIPVLEFIKRLRMTEERAIKIEQDEFSFNEYSSLKGFLTSKNVNSIRAFGGFHLNLSKDKKEVSIVITENDTRKGKSI